MAMTADEKLRVANRKLRNMRKDAEQPSRIGKLVEVAAVPYAAGLGLGAIRETMGDVRYSQALIGTTVVGLAGSVLLNPAPGIINAVLQGLSSAGAATLAHSHGEMLARMVRVKKAQKELAEMEKQPVLDDTRTEADVIAMDETREPIAAEG
jgi:hypothetical protein